MGKDVGSGKVPTTTEGSVRSSAAHLIVLLLRRDTACNKNSCCLSFLPSAHINSINNNNAQVVVICKHLHAARSSHGLANRRCRFHAWAFAKKSSTNPTSRLELVHNPGALLSLLSERLAGVVPRNASTSPLTSCLLLASAAKAALALRRLVPSGASSPAACAQPSGIGHCPYLSITPTLQTCLTQYTAPN